MVTKRSRHSYSDTLAMLKQAMTEGGNTIFAIIDQAAAAASVGMSLRPTTLIVFGNPRGGTPLMDSFPFVALDLPLKLLVWEEAGNVDLVYVPASEIAKRYNVTGMDARIAAMDNAIDTLTSVVA